MFTLKIFKSLLINSLLLFVPFLNLEAQFNGQFSIQENRLFLESFLDYKIYSEDSNLNNLTRENNFFYSLGTLTENNLYSRHYLNFSKKVFDNVSASFTQNRESFFREEILYQEMEVRYGETWFLSALGYGDYSKNSNNVGGAIGYNQNSAFIRASYVNQGQTQYNLDNEESNIEFAQEPSFVRLEAFFELDNLSIRSIIKSEFKTEAKSFEDERELEYAGNEYEIAGEYEISPTTKLKANLKRDYEERKQLFKNTSISFPNLFQTIEFRWHDIALVHSMGLNNLVEVGTTSSSFSNDVSPNFEALRFEYLNESNIFYVSYNLKSLDFSYKIMFLNARGEQNIIDSDFSEKTTYTQNRITSAIYYNKEDVKVFFKFSADLDSGEQSQDGSMLGIQLLI